MSSIKKVDLTVIIVSYNTKILTLKCLETLFESTKNTSFHTVVFDNASVDGSADAIALAYPEVELIRSQENLGFAKANNLVAEMATTDWLLLLNPDTEVYSGSIDRLMEFSKKKPNAGITGGRTVFPDGSLNISSCWQRITAWSLFCQAFGLSFIFPKSQLFNPEAMVSWRRDTVREVDIVVGCFFMIQRSLWTKLGGFDLRYFMYGEEADLCLRAAKIGFQPMITPDAEIMHLVGASTSVRAEKQILVAKARATLIRDHWSKLQVPIGLAFMWIWGGSRTIISRLLAIIPSDTNRKRAENWRMIWSRRRDWLSGY